jgi:hypothetical protein
MDGGKTIYADELPVDSWPLLRDDLPRLEFFLDTSRFALNSRSWRHMDWRVAISMISCAVEGRAYVVVLSRGAAHHGIKADFQVKVGRNFHTKVGVKSGN